MKLNAKEKELLAFIIDQHYHTIEEGAFDFLDDDLLNGETIEQHEESYKALAKKLKDELGLPY